MPKNLPTTLGFATTKTMKNGVAHHVVSHIVFSSVFRIRKAAKIMVSHGRGHRNHEFGEGVPRSVLGWISDQIFEDFRVWAVLANPMFDAYGFQFRFGIDLASIFGQFSFPWAPPRQPTTAENNVSDTLDHPPRFLHQSPGPKSWFLGVPGTDVGSILHAHRLRETYPLSTRLVLERRREYAKLGLVRRRTRNSID